MSFFYNSGRTGVNSKLPLFLFAIYLFCSMEFWHGAVLPCHYWSLAVTKKLIIKFILKKHLRYSTYLLYEKFEVHDMYTTKTKNTFLLEFIIIIPIATNFYLWTSYPGWIVVPPVYIHFI